MFRNIHEHRLFTSFASYSLQNICTDSHTNTRLMQKINVAADRFSQIGEYLLQNIRLEANICKTLREFHIQANIRL